MRAFTVVLGLCLGVLSPLSSAKDDKQATDELGDAEAAQPSAALASTEEASKVADQDRMICRREKAIGSNRITRICRIAEQLEREQVRAREQMTNTERGSGR